MKPPSLRLKLAWSRLRDGARDLKSRLSSRVGNSDDTVEAQAETFRIWMWSSAAGLSLILITVVISAASGKSELVKAQNEADKSFLDGLPEGYVIAPIEPTNVDSLDSIFEQHGYADLYTSDGENRKGRRVARGLALIRAPRNPRRFAVLIPETQSEVLAELAEPVLVILRKKPKPNESSARLPSLKKQRDSPLVREPRANIELIEEEIPISQSEGTDT